jgi:hypothetical protein
MKKAVVFMFSLFLVTVVFAQTKTYYYPATGKSIISLKIPTKTWSVSDEASWMSFQPTDETDTGRLIAMIWKSENPGAEDAVTSLVNECFELVESLLVDIEWKEDTEEFQINEMDFVGIDGWGDYVNKDGSKDEMMVSVSVFFPDDDNLMAFVFFGLNSAYKKHEKEFQDIMFSINSTK